MASAGSSATANIVKTQQAYATTQRLAKLFEDLTTALVYARPADPAAFIAAEAARMAAEGEAYRAKPINGVIDTEESAAAYWEDERVRALLEVRMRAGARRRSMRRHLPLGICRSPALPRARAPLTHRTFSTHPQELFALLLHSKPADPLAFLREESLKLQALRAGAQPVRAPLRSAGALPLRACAY